ncbi:hypothetical protein JQ628_11535 [Bradyrhizobium lablabi]|uniref:hypothetical protein n=1 Tax=Bradyrhizobium lablabi TaxID=722472 RepID=UPI001BADD98E|nr:hypothetical protein [Bradyrhizobium lablabi]MBR1122148.1 hypothetical protein [Bradyrhizobium lablabi]
MLAQNFKTAEDLDITEPQKDALIKTLVLLETGKLVHDRGHFQAAEREEMGTINRFSMRLVFAKGDCGTVGCICGIAETLGGEGIGTRYGHALDNLFCPPSKIVGNWANITPAQAATALRSYLTTGDARWDLAVTS